MTAGGAITLMAMSLLGTASLCLGLWVRRKELAARNWPQTSGTIVASRVEIQPAGKGRSQAIPVIEYEFRYSERQFCSSHRRVGNYVTGSVECAEAVASRYPVGREVTVFVNSKVPAQSVLEHGSTPLSWIPLGFGTALLMLAVSGLLLLRTEARRNPTKRLPQSLEEYRAALGQPDFGMFFADFSQTLPAPNHDLTVDNAKVLLDEFLGRRSANMGAGKSFGDLIGVYSTVARKRVSYGRAWVGVTNDIPFGDAIPRTRRESLDRMEGILRAQGGFIFPLDRTNVVLLTAKELRDLGRAVESARPRAQQRP